MSQIKLSSNASGTGIFTIESPATNTNRTLTLPDNTGTILTSASTIAGTGPAFSAYVGSDQTVTTGTWTKLSCNTEEFDTANCFDSTTNYRFTPNVAGYYQISGQVSCSSSSTITLSICNLYKNGSAFKNGNYLTSSGASNRVLLSTLVYLNGSTDYLEFYGRIDGSGTLKFLGNNNDSFFQAALVRAA